MEELRVLFIFIGLILLVILYVIIYQECKKESEEERKQRDRILKILETIDSRLFSLELDDYVRKEQRKCRKEEKKK